MTINQLKLLSVTIYAIAFHIIFSWSIIIFFIHRGVYIGDGVIICNFIVSTLSLILIFGLHNLRIKSFNDLMYLQVSALGDVQLHIHISQYGFPKGADKSRSIKKSSVQITRGIKEGISYCNKYRGKMVIVSPLADPNRMISLGFSGWPVSRFRKNFRVMAYKANALAAKIIFKRNIPEVDLENFSTTWEKQFSK